MKTIFKAMSILFFIALYGCGSSSSTTPTPLTPTPYFWSPNTAYSAGAVLNFHESSAVFHATATTGGTSGSVEPIIPIGGSAKDGSVVWQYTGPGVAE